jgi:5-methylcytosine-specific restriction protein A
VRYCDEHLAEHRREQDARRGTAAERGYDARWQAKRDQFLAEHPICLTPGCGKRATVAHHKIRRRDGGTDDPENLEARCDGCHSRLHAKSGDSFKPA